MERPVEPMLEWRAPTLPVTTRALDSIGDVVGTLVTSGYSRDAEVAALVAPWLAERRAFWERLFEERIEDAAIWAGLAAAYVTDEGFNGLVVGDDPDYRLLRPLFDRLYGGFARHRIRLGRLFGRHCDSGSCRLR